MTDVLKIGCDAITEEGFLCGEEMSDEDMTVPVGNHSPQLNLDESQAPKRSSIRSVNASEKLGDVSGSGDNHSRERENTTNLICTRPMSSRMQNLGSPDTKKWYRCYCGAFKIFRNCKSCRRFYKE